MSEVIALERKCSIEEVFCPSFIELLRLVPRNPYVRALILKFTGKMPGTDCGTFDQLKDWVELNCVKRIRSPFNTGNSGAGISVSVRFSETEYGRASYSVDRSSTENFEFGADDLLALIQEKIADGGGISEVLDAIADRIDDDAWDQCSPNLDNYGDYDYCDDEATSSDSREAKFSRESIRIAVLQFVQQRHPELAAEL
jgi:hypothetical protein